MGNESAPPPPPPLRVQTCAGSGRIGAADGPSEAATFSFPHAVLPLPDGSALVSDTNNDAVRHVSVDERGLYNVRRVGAKGFTWMRPRGLAQLPDGGVLVCDSGHNRIRLLGADGSVSVFAGSGRRGLVDGSAANAAFDNPSGICVCADGSVLVADTGNNSIRAISSAPPTERGGVTKRIVSTLAGTGRTGCIDGPAAAATFDKPSAVLALGSPRDLASGDGVVYVADSANHCIRTIAASTSAKQPTLCVSTLCGKPGLAGHTDGSFERCLLACPSGLAVLPDGTIAVTDSSNNAVRRLAVEARVASTLAGSKERAWGLVDGPSAQARFNAPKGLAVSPSGDMWIADSQNHCVRLVREDVQATSAAALREAEARHRAALLQLPAPTSKASWEGGRSAPHPSAMIAVDHAIVPAAGRFGDENESESFATDGFAAEAQLFEREGHAPSTTTFPKGGGIGDSARGGWTYTGAASVTLRRAPHRTATLRVQVHGAPSTELSVLRPGQLKLRDTAFVVCSRETSGARAAETGFGVNELGLRFSTTTAAASLLAACEAMVSGEAAAAALIATLPEIDISDEFHERGVSARAPGGPMAPTKERPVSAIPTLRRPRANAAPAEDGSVEARLQHAEQDVLRLSARLAERDVEAGRLRSQLEQAQNQLRSRDAKVAELTRRLALLSKRT